MGTGGEGGEGESSFNRGVCFSDGGASFLGWVCAPWGALVLMEGGISKKTGGWGTPSHAPSPHYGKPCQLYIPEIGVIM